MKVTGGLELKKDWGDTGKDKQAGEGMIVDIQQGQKQYSGHLLR